MSIKEKLTQINDALKYMKAVRKSKGVSSVN